MRSYSVAIAALALDAPKKWVDNVISQHHVPLVASFSRGVGRSIPFSSLLHLAVARQLHVQLGLGVADALRIAVALMSRNGAEAHECGELRLTVDLPRLERRLMSKLADALESAPSPARGRPARQSDAGRGAR